MGWDPCDDRWWPEIAEALAKPWPREAVLMDLRWWASRARRGVSGMPGRRFLRARWGWDDWQARCVMRAESEWADPANPPASLPPPSRLPPASLLVSEEKPALDRTVPPASLPPPSRLPPASLHTRVGDTEHRTQTQVTGESPPLPPPADLANPGPPGDDPSIPGSFYARIWLDVMRAAGVLRADQALTKRESAAAEQIARLVGGDRNRLVRVVDWVGRSEAYEAKRARESLGRGELRWVLEDWPALDRLAHANGHAGPKKRRGPTPDEREAMLAAKAKGAADA